MGLLSDPEATLSSTGRRSILHQGVEVQSYRRQPPREWFQSIATRDAKKSLFGWNLPFIFWRASSLFNSNKQEQKGAVFSRQSLSSEPLGSCIWCSSSVAFERLKEAPSCHQSLCPPNFSNVYYLITLSKTLEIYVHPRNTGNFFRNKRKPLTSCLFCFVFSAHESCYKLFGQGKGLININTYSTPWWGATKVCSKLDGCDRVCFVGLLSGVARSMW